MTERFFTSLVAGLPATVPFVGPDQHERERGAPFRARLGANESGFGPSSAAVEAMREAAEDAWMYGDATNHDLREAIARHHAIAPESVVVGEGIDGLLGNLVRMTVSPGEAVVTSDGAYPTFNYHVAGHGGDLVRIPYSRDREDPEALARAVRSANAKLVYLSNPDNPMGSVHEADTLIAFRAALPEDCLLCLDEAYADFAPEGVVPPWDAMGPATIRFRTFSKAYGLAGLRVGYAVGEPSLIAGFDRIRNHFGVNRLGQVAARAALGDTAHMDRVLTAVEESKARISRIALANGLQPLPSATNFVAVDCGRDGDFARAVLARLMARDVFVRMPGVAPLDRCIRISCGPEADMAVLEAELPAALAEARQEAA